MTCLEYMNMMDKEELNYRETRPQNGRLMLIIALLF
jgi:hypothetical protein